MQSIIDCIKRYTLHDLSIHNMAMQNVNLNLLVALDALLAERSVTGAARRLGLSVSAMSRTLTRLRNVTGDRLLLQAGRTLVLTPYAEQLSLHVPILAREVQTVLRPASHLLDLETLEQSFTIRSGEGFIDLLAGALIEKIRQAAPRVLLRFTPKLDWDAQPLREGAIDLEIGTVQTSAPEIRTRLLFHDRYVGVCRSGHPILNEPDITMERYTAYEHVVTSRTGHARTQIDAALESRGLKRRIPIVVPAYTHAMQIVRYTDLLAVIPYSCLGNPFTPDYARVTGLQNFELPMSMPTFHVSAIWHPRLDKDPAHAWLRAEVLEVCQAAYPPMRHPM